MRIPWLAAVVVAVDQLTKHWAVTCLKPVGTISVVPGLFSLSYVENPGAAWGMLAGKNLFLVIFSLVTLGFLFWKRRELFGSLWCGSLTLSLIAAGVVGNLIDRVRLNFVIDFLDFFWGRSHFPAFNVADSAICVGVFLYIATQWHHDKMKENLGVRS
jgi:signal peptidase II